MTPITKPVLFSGWTAWFRSDWINPFNFESFNWIDFTFVLASCEWDRRFGNLEAHIAIFGLHVGGSVNIGSGDEELKEYLRKKMAELGIADEYSANEPHPFQDVDALTGNITTPAGAQSGEVIDTTRAAYRPNLPRPDEGS